jgi:hypothetical protein
MFHFSHCAPPFEAVVVFGISRQWLFLNWRRTKLEKKENTKIWREHTENVLTGKNKTI